MGRKTDFYTQDANAHSIVTKSLTKHIELFKKEVARKDALEKKKAALKAQEEAEKKAHEVKV